MKPPKISWHKATSRWYVRISGKVFYLSKKAKKTVTPPKFVEERYREVLAEYQQRLTDKPETFSFATNQHKISSLVHRYGEHVKAYYRIGGRESSEIHVCRSAMRYLLETWGDMKARDFGPRQLKAYQSKLVKVGIARKTINRYSAHVVRLFKWSASEEIIRHDIYDALKTVEPISPGRTEAPESEKVKPVSFEVLKETARNAPEPIDSMILVHYLIGCRSDEVCKMKKSELKKHPGQKKVWVFVPTYHKTKSRGKDIRYFVGPKCQKILAPLIAKLAKNEDGYLFQVRKVRGNGQRQGCYTSDSYRRLISRLCAKFGIPEWAPRQVRHSRGTDVRAKAGLETAQSVLSHSEMDTTQIYAERNDDLAIKFTIDEG